MKPRGPDTSVARKYLETVFNTWWQETGEAIAVWWSGELDQIDHIWTINPFELLNNISSAGPKALSRFVKLLDRILDAVPRAVMRGINETVTPLLTRSSSQQVVKRDVAIRDFVRFATEEVYFVIEGDLDAPVSIAKSHGTIKLILTVRQTLSNVGKLVAKVFRKILFLVIDFILLVEKAYAMLLAIQMLVRFCDLLDQGEILKPLDQSHPREKQSVRINRRL